MRICDIIEKKRDGLALSDKEIAFFTSGVADGSIPDYQSAALLMAMYLRGMNDNETVMLTQAMAHSGEMLDMSRFGNMSVDKHSTGGVGDKTTPIIAPIVAATGCIMAKMSGRGLGHTGGTVDKLASIDGYRVSLEPEEFMSVAEKQGICVIAAGKELAPADKKLYALRDVTATVGSIPLIVSSIMSKKLAGGSKNIVLDVKNGSGAFIRNKSEVPLLAEKMVAIGKASGRNVSAVITDMDRPLGKCIGNSIEICEAVALLRGEESDPALKEICLTLASRIIALAHSTDAVQSRRMAEEALESGRAYERFIGWISAQGGNTALLEKGSGYGSAKYTYRVTARRSGYITAVDTAGVGIAAMLLGAGRAKASDDIDPSAGIILERTRGDYVAKGETVAVMQSSSVTDFSLACEKFLCSLTFGTEKPAEEPLVYGTI